MTTIGSALALLFAWSLSLSTKRYDEGTDTMKEIARAVSICTRSAQKEIIIPSHLAIISPLIAGIFPGPSRVVGNLAGALISGPAVALMMAHSGGAWDNAKKYIEKGNFGGKGSQERQLAVIGDTVGDPFKDTAGPSLNIFIRLMATSSITLAGSC